MTMKLCIKRGLKIEWPMLSRYATIHAMSMPVHQWVEEIVKEVANNPYTVHIMDEKMDGSSAYPNFTLHNGQLLYKG